MSVTDSRELPPDRQTIEKRAVRLEYLTIAYLISAIAGIYLTLGSSQAMKTAWFEDILSLIPPIAFLVASRFRQRDTDERFPYGYHKVVSIAFLCAALALFSMGAFLLFDSVTTLISFEHPSIGVVQLFGHQIWLGWLMLPALVWSGVPAVVLGRKKLPLARALHDKVLYADAEMNKADWLTASAAMVGVIGIAFGLWWADGVAASVISFDILHDGYSNLKQVVKDLMDGRPTLVGNDRLDPLPARVETELKSEGWIRDARVRLREDGHVFFGEAFVVPTDDTNLVERIRDLTERVKGLDWRLYDLVIMPVSELPESTQETG